ncbi:MAG: alpha/beta hydrolase [Rhodothermales bacterium]|nr:alpha/beta hydrolase [Rhodothermales bacterium]
MQHDAGTLRTSDGLTLATRQWRPHDGAKAAVLLVHGLGEHSGRYAHVATRLMLADYAVLAYDHRGHGRSEGLPRAYFDRIDLLVRDLGTVLEWARAEGPDQPLFLLGHSLGGAVAALHVIEHGADDLRGLVLSSAALKLPDAPPPMLRRVAGFASETFPRLPIARLKLADLSRDPRTVRAYREDPLTFNGRVPARVGYELLRATEQIQARPEAFRLPLYLFHGTADRITDPDGTRRLYEHAATDDKRLTLYEGFYHETMNAPDTDRQRVLDDLVAWLDAHAE